MAPGLGWGLDLFPHSSGRPAGVQQRAPSRERQCETCPIRKRLKNLATRPAGLSVQSPIMTGDPSTIQLFDRPGPAGAALAALPDAQAGWFRARLGEPTAVQRLAWPLLAARRHVL